MDPTPFAENELSFAKRAIDDIHMALYHAEYYYRSATEENHKNKAIEFLHKALEHLNGRLVAYEQTK